MGRFECILFFLMAMFAFYVGATVGDFSLGRAGDDSAGEVMPAWFSRLMLFGFAAIAAYWGMKSLHV